MNVGSTGVIEVYKSDTREVIRRFLLHQLSFSNCIAAFDAAFAGLMPRLYPEEIDELRAVMLANNETVMKEMERRATAGRLAYRVKIPIKGLANNPLTDTIIPAGSTIEWKQGDYSGGMASVFWSRQRVLVVEGDLFSYCERLSDGTSTQI